MSYVVLALKWRPQTFDEVAGQEAIGHTLKNAIDQGRTAHAYLFTGPRGVGKTSTARILAKALNCVNGPTSTPCNVCDSCREITSGRALDVLEIDGASNRGIDDIRELRESVRYAPAAGRAKVYIIDEVHMLTTDAFNALLKTLEEPPSHVVFVLATTEPLKVPATILSRCQRFDFARLRMRDTLNRLQTICTAEGIEVTEDGLSIIARRAEGSMRDALTLLDQVIASGRRPLDSANVSASLGISGRDLYFELSEAMLAQDAHRALSILTTAYNDGQNLQEVAEEFVGHLRNLLMLSDSGELAELVEATDAERDLYRAQAQRAHTADLIRQLHIAIEASVKMRRSAFPRVLLEVAIAEICMLPRSIDLASALRSLPDGGGVDTAPAAPQSRVDTATASRQARLQAALQGGQGPAQSQTQSQAQPQRPIEPPQRPMPPPPTVRDEPPAGSAVLTGSSTGTATAAPVAAEPATATAPPAAPSFPMSDDPWVNVIQIVKAKKRVLAATLETAFITGEDNGFLKISFGGGVAPFQKSALEHADNRPVLQAAIREAYGRPLGWRIDTSEAVAPPPGATQPAEGGVPPKRRGTAPPPGARANLADIERIAGLLDGDVIGPS